MLSQSAAALATRSVVSTRREVTSSCSLTTSSAASARMKKPVNTARRRGDSASMRAEIVVLFLSAPIRRTPQSAAFIDDRFRPSLINGRPFLTMGGLRAGCACFSQSESRKLSEHNPATARSRVYNLSTYSHFAAAVTQELGDKRKLLSRFAGTIAGSPSHRDCPTDSFPQSNVQGWLWRGRGGRAQGVARFPAPRRDRAASCGFLASMARSWETKKS